MKVTCFVVLTCCSFSALATSITDNFLSKETYYHRGAEGWYWYHDPVIKEKTEKEPTLSQGDKSIPSIPPVLSAAWVRKMIPVYRPKTLKRFLSCNAMQWIAVKSLLKWRNP